MIAPSIQRVRAAEAEAAICEAMLSDNHFRNIIGELKAAQMDGKVAELRRRVEEADKQNAAFTAEVLANAGLVDGAFRVKPLSAKEGGGFNVERFTIDYRTRKAGWVKQTWCAKRDAADKALAMRAK